MRNVYRTCSFRYALLAFAALLFAAIIPSSAGAQTSCPTVITSNTTLSSDCTAPVAIVIAADGVTFNGGGHTVDCAGSGTGISIVDRTAVSVTNMTIIHCGTGINVVGGGSHVFDTNLNVLNNPTCPPAPGGRHPPSAVWIALH